MHAMALHRTESTWHGIHDHPPPAHRRGGCRAADALPGGRDHLRFLEAPTDACDGPIVIGDLICASLFVDDIASLIVSGNLRARVVIANGTIRMFGDLHYQIVAGTSFCNRIFGCLGTARLDAMFEDRHFFDFHGNVEASLIAPVFNVVKLPEGARIERDFRAGRDAGQTRAAFDASLPDADGALDHDLVCRAPGRPLAAALSGFRGMARCTHPARYRAAPRRGDTRWPAGIGTGRGVIIPACSRRAIRPSARHRRTRGPTGRT